MSQPEDSQATCWTLIQSASAGSEEDREQFAARYVAIVRMYLAHRWRGTSMLSELDDAIQEVFLELFREGGVLDVVQERRPNSFRSFLYGVSRNVARRREKDIGRQRRRYPAVDIDPERHEAEEASQSRVFDRAWAQAIFRHDRCGHNDCQNGNKCYFKQLFHLFCLLIKIRLTSSIHWRTRRPPQWGPFSKSKQIPENLNLKSSGYV